MNLNYVPFNFSWVPSFSFQKQTSSFWHFNIFAQLRLQQINQIRFHVVVIIGNMQADNPFPNQALAEFVPQLLCMLLLHDEDQISPADMSCCDSYPGSRFRAGRLHFITWKSSIHPFGRKASPPITTAHKKQLLARSHTLTEWISLIPPPVAHVSSSLPSPAGRFL